MSRPVITAMCGGEYSRLPAYLKAPAWPILFVLGMSPCVVIFTLPIRWGVHDMRPGLCVLMWWLAAGLNPACFPLWVRYMLGVKYRWPLRIWLLPFCLVFGSLGPALFLVSWFGFGILAVPFIQVVIAVAYGLYSTPLLYVALPRSFRSTQDGRKKFLQATVIIWFFIVGYGLVYPLLNVPFRSGSSTEQLGIATLFIALRFGFEHLSKVLEWTSLHPDAYPLLLFASIVFYEFFVSAIFQDITQWYVFLVLIGWDVAENTLALIWIRRVGVRKKKILPLAVVRSRVSAKSSESQHSESMSTLDAKALCMLATITIKEVAEVIAPTCYLFMAVIIYNFNPELNANLAFMSPESFRRTVTFLVVEILCELGVMVATAVAVQTYLGCSMLQIGAGLAIHYGWTFQLTILCAVIYYLGLSYTPTGADWSLEFLWLNPDAQWHGGQCWSLPSNSTELPPCAAVK